MNFKLEATVWQQPTISAYFNTYDRAMTAAWGLLGASIPVSIVVLEFVDGQGYKKEIFTQNNEECL